MSNADLCNLCTLKSLPFHSLFTETPNLSRESVLPSGTHNFFKSCNSLDTDLDFDDYFFASLNSKYRNVNEFNGLNVVNAFSTLHLNIASLNKYSEDLSTLISSLEIPINVIAVTEHKLSATSFLFHELLNYDFVFTPTKSTHGGAGFFVSKNHSFFVRTDLNFSIDNCCEIITVEIVLETRKNILCSCVYRHPSSSIAEFNESVIDKLLSRLCLENKTCILSGDFNINLLNSSTNNAISNFFQKMCSYFFVPHILQPTRITVNSATLIDNIFTNSPELDTFSGNLEYQISDHLVQYLIINNFYSKATNILKTKMSIIERDYKFFNNNEFLIDLKNFDWDSLFGPYDDLNLSFAKFYETLLYFLDEHAPEKSLTHKQISLKSKPWINCEIRHKINVRDNLLRKFRICKDPVLKISKFEDYKKMRNDVSKLVVSSKKAFYHGYFKRFSLNTDKVWKGIKSIISLKPNKHRSIDTIKVDDCLTTDKADIANAFNTFFTGIGPEIAKTISTPKNRTFKDYFKNQTTTSFFLHLTTAEEISKIITNLNSKKSGGPNSIPVKILKYCADVLSKPLSLLINMSFNQGTFPNLLKTAKVIPVFKKGDASLCTNYRPISLLSVFSKIFEKCFHTRLYTYLDKNNMIYKRQFGFRTKYSTNDALVNLIETIKKLIDDGNFVCNIFIDLQKAFDTVNHEILLEKLNFYGIRGVANNWLRTFLCDRHQFVYINGYRSSLQLLKCGVPQGSTLGPLLFLLYINDLNLAFNHIVTNHFADDTCLMFSSNNLNSLEKVVNNELKLLVEWLECNKLSLNVSKTEMLVFNLHKCPNHSLTIKLNDHKLQPTDHVKYLGIFIDSNLSFDFHISHICKKLSQANGIISKLRYFLKTETCLSVYYTIFYPHLLYGTNTWQFSTKANISKLCVLQRKCLRLISFSEYDDSANPLFILYNVLKVEDVFLFEILKFFVKFELDILPAVLKDLFSLSSSRTVNLNVSIRNSNTFSTCSYKTAKFGRNSLRYLGVSSWIDFIKHNKCQSSLSSVSCFKSVFKKISFDKYIGLLNS